jgi:hypothetical protein
MTRISSPTIVASIASSILAASCGSATAPEPPTQMIQETLTGAINASLSPTCSSAFQLSVAASYYAGGTQRCAEYARSSHTGGKITARLTWQDRRIDLDLVLNDTVRTNFSQSIAANRGGETIDFTLKAGTTYMFVVYLRGVDPQFVANGGTFTGDVSTAFTLAIERPQ